MPKKLMLKESQIEMLDEFEEAQQTWGWEAAEGRNRKNRQSMKQRAQQSRKALEQEISKLNKRIRKLKEAS